MLLPNALLPKAPELSAAPEDAETLGNELVEAALDAKRPPLELLDAKMLLRGAVVASDLKMSPLEDVPAEKIDVEPLPEVVDETPVLDELLLIPNRLPVDAAANSKAGAAEAVDPNKLPVEATLEPNNEPLEADEASMLLGVENANKELPDDEDFDGKEVSCNENTLCSLGVGESCDDVFDKLGWPKDIEL